MSRALAVMQPRLFPTLFPQSEVYSPLLAKVSLAGAHEAGMAGRALRTW